MTAHQGWTDRPAGGSSAPVAEKTPVRKKELQTFRQPKFRNMKSVGLTTAASGFNDDDDVDNNTMVMVLIKIMTAMKLLKEAVHLLQRKLL